MPPSRPSLFPRELRGWGQSLGVGKAQKVPETFVPAPCQTPYFWTSTLWPAAELDYGERGGVGQPG